jgi:hypothetical protein
MTMKIGCIVYVQLPAMLKPCYRQFRKDLRKEPDDGVLSDGLLVLFLN